jgi:hypothetical protein
MREFAKVAPQFWTGQTSRDIRKMGLEARVIACYLITAPGSSMLGLYYLPIGLLAHETGCPLEGASKALRSLSEAGFCRYSDDEEVIWIPEMARHQIGERLEPGDKRCKGIETELWKYHKSIFFNEFVKKYKEAYHLPFNITEESPLQAPSKPLSKPLGSKETETETENEIEKETIPPASPTATPKPEPKPAKPKAPTTGDHAEVMDHIKRTWEAAYSNGSVVKMDLGGKAGATVKTLLDLVGRDVGLAKAAWDRYMADRSEFACKTRHSIGLFRANINQYTAGPPVKPKGQMPGIDIPGHCRIN